MIGTTLSDAPRICVAAPTSFAIHVHPAKDAPLPASSYDVSFLTSPFRVTPRITAAPVLLIQLGDLLARVSGVAGRPG
jgi:hypothetical protein